MGVSAQARVVEALLSPEEREAVWAHNLEAARAKRSGDAERYEEATAKATAIILRLLARIESKT